MCGWAAPTAKPMNFIDASGKSLNMLPRNCIAAFEQLKQLLNVEGANLSGHPPFQLPLAAWQFHRSRGESAQRRLTSAPVCPPRDVKSTGTRSNPRWIAWSNGVRPKRWVR